MISLAAGDEGEIVGDEIEVLEEGEEADVDEDAEDQEEAFTIFVQVNSACGNGAFAGQPKQVT
jgi:hypothetical protein